MTTIVPARATRINSLWNMEFIRKNLDF